MPADPYTSFSKAADHLVIQFTSLNSEKITSTVSVPPVVCTFLGTLEGFAAISDNYPHLEPFPGIILSHLEDADGLIAECLDMTYTVKAPPALVNADIDQGDKIIIELLMSIKPPGVKNSSEWPIRYHHVDQSYDLGFVGSVYFRKI